MPHHDLRQGTRPGIFSHRDPASHQLAMQLPVFLLPPGRLLAMSTAQDKQGHHHAHGQYAATDKQGNTPDIRAAEQTLQQTVLAITVEPEHLLRPEKAHVVDHVVELAEEWQRPEPAITVKGLKESIPLAFRCSSRPNSAPSGR